MKARLILLFALLGLTHLPAREWRSAAGGRTLEGDFLRLTGDQVQLKPAKGQAMTVGLALLSAEDQTFAKTAQAALEAAAKMGPQMLEVVQPLTVGLLCRLGVKMSSGSILYTGTQFLLITDQASALAPGTKVKDQPLYPAGDRKYHTSQGGATPLRAFATSAQLAAEDTLLVAAGTRPADVMEPVVAVVEATSIGFAIGEDGLVLVDSALLEGATAISVDTGNDQAPGTVVASDPELGVSVLSCKGVLLPARLAPRKPVELGQPIYALSLGLTSTRRSVADPAITKGIISKLSGPGGKELYFQHDAAVDTESLGGVVLSEKGDVLGVMIPRTRIKGTPRSAAEAPSTSSLGTCVRTEALVTFLKTVPKVSATRAASESSLQASGDAIKKAGIIVRITKETRREATAPPTMAGAPGTSTGTPPPSGASGWSLSKAGIRHNAKCQYFNARYPCTETEGRACKACGG